MRPSTARMAGLCFSVAAACTLVSAQAEFQVGYALMTPDPGRPAPVASALFSSRNAQGVLIWEAAVAAGPAIPRGRVFVDQSAGSRTGIALVNPSDSAVTVSLTLRDAAGVEVSQSEEAFSPGQQRSLFVDELFAGVAGFRGSLTFDAGEGALAAVALLQSTNAHGEAIFVTLPVADLEASPTESLIFPQVGAGQGLTTRIILINASSSAVAGEVQFFDAAGAPLVMLLNGTAGSTHAYEIAADGTFEASLAGARGVAVGSARVTLSEGNRAPEGVALFQFVSGSSIVSGAAVSASTPTARSRIFVDQEGTRTGIALANPSDQPATVTFNLLDTLGNSLRQASQQIEPRGQRAVFADELFSGLLGFTGLLEITSSEAVSPVSLKLTINGRGEPVLTTLPVADLADSPLSETLIFPQLGFGDFEGGSFATRLIFINGDLEGSSTGRLNFHAPDGAPLSLPLAGQTASEFSYRFPPGGGQRLSIGSSGSIAQIIVNPADPAARELVVNEGGSLQLAPLVLDEKGNRVEGAALDFAVLDSQVAAVDEFGAVAALGAGFTTLTVSSSEVVSTATLTVVRVDSGAGGFEVSGLAQDPAGRLYLANAEEHIILLAPDAAAEPAIYAGGPLQAGLINGPRLESRFNQPTFLALNQAEGALYVADTSNHVIRSVSPGQLGLVGTLAGQGRAGSADGAAAQASFRTPRGIALDTRGRIWIADSGNHTIRQIDLVTGQVRTVAGRAGEAGLVDGVGEQARFDSPAGLALEPESLAAQLQREALGEPPPPTRVIVADTGNSTLRRVEESGRVETLATEPDASAAVDPPGGRLRQVALQAPEAVTVDSLGNIYVALPGLNEVRIVLQNGQTVPAAQSGTFSGPRALAAGRGGEILVADAGSAALRLEFGAPVITRVTPEEIDAAGGAAVTVGGKNFSPETTVVLAGQVITGLQRVDTESLVFTAPALPSGVATLSVQNRGGLDQAPLRIRPASLDELPPGGITTVAGGSTFSGDGAAAEAAALRAPGALAIDAAGNLMLSDTGNHRVRRVEAATGIITSIAGTGVLASTGDGGLATAADVAFPSGLALGPSGDLYVAEEAGQKVRRIDAATGEIMTVAGTGLRGFAGDGGPARDARLNAPAGLAFDSAGNLLIADKGNHSIRRVDRNGVITTVAGTGVPIFSGDGGPAVEATLSSPDALALDSAGHLLIADTFNHRIRRISPAGTITTVAGNGTASFSGDGGSATAAGLFSPRGVAADSSGNVYVADTGNHRVRRVGAATGLIITVAGNGESGFSGDGGPAALASLAFPQSVRLDAGENLIIADRGNSRVRVVEAASGVISTLAGAGQLDFVGDGDPAFAAALNFPFGVALRETGELLIADSGNNRIREVGGPDQTIQTVAGDGLSLPGAVIEDSAGGLLVADSGNHVIRRVDAATGLIATVAGSGLPGDSGDGGPALEASLNAPRGLALNPLGVLLVANAGSNRVRQIDLEVSRIDAFAGTGRQGFAGDFGAARDAELSAPSAVAVDSAANVYIADTFNHRIRCVAFGSIILTVAGNGVADFSGDGGPGIRASLNTPRGLAVDGQGNLFIADTLNNRVRRLDAVTGVITTVAGNGSVGFSGDGGPAEEATLNFPFAVSVDASGNLFIADTLNHRIRAVKGTN